MSERPGISEALRRRPEGRAAVAALDRLRLVVRVEGSKLMGDHHRLVSRGDEATAKRIRAFVETVAENLMMLEQAVADLLVRSAEAELEEEEDTAVFKR